MLRIDYRKPLDFKIRPVHRIIGIAPHDKRTFLARLSFMIPIILFSASRRSLIEVVISLYSRHKKRPVVISRVVQLTSAEEAPTNYCKSLLIRTTKFDGKDTRLNFSCQIKFNLVNFCYNPA